MSVDTVSVRQRVIENMCATLLDSGLVDDVTDDELPRYEKARKGWVFEGDEDERIQDTKYVTADLLLFVHTTYEFDANDPHRQPRRIGREILAQHQNLFVKDHERGGYAFNTVPAGNSIGVAEPAPTTRGIVESRWRITYRRARLNAYER